MLSWVTYTVAGEERWPMTLCVSEEAHACLLPPQQWNYTAQGIRQTAYLA